MPDQKAPNIRPLQPGEYRKNKDGSYSTEISKTVKNPMINEGMPTNIPSLYVVDGVVKEFQNEDEAVRAAIATGLNYPSFASIPDAVQAARQRTDKGGIADGPLGKPSEKLVGKK